MAAVLAVASGFLSLWTYPEVSADTLFREEVAVGAFQHARRLNVSPQSWIYVVDEGRNLIQVFKSSTSEPTAVGGYGWVATTFDKPTGIAGDGLNIYISDYGNHRVQRFDRNMNYISSLATRDTNVTPARFGYPSGVALSKAGDLFILDSENLRVIRFSRDGQFIQSFGGIEAERGRLQRPMKIVVSEDEKIYVAEASRILEYDYFGNFVRMYGDGILSNVRSCDATAEYVVALTMDSLLWFSKDGMLVSTLMIATLITSEPLRDVQDILFVRNQMYLLDAHRLFVFSIVRTQ